jgi:hypothetical protein
MRFSPLADLVVGICCKRRAPHSISLGDSDARSMRARRLRVPLDLQRQALSSGSGIADRVPLGTPFQADRIALASPEEVTGKNRDAILRSQVTVTVP